MTEPSDAQSPALLDLSSLPRLADGGFDGGRSSFHRFIAMAFGEGRPRFYSLDGEDLVVVRHADLRAFGAITQVATVPPAVLFPFAYADSGPSPDTPAYSLASIISNQVFTANPPIHGPIRKLLLNQFGPRPTEALEPLAREAARAIASQLRDGEIIDFVGAVAERLTASFWGAVLRLDPDEIDAVRESVRAMTPMLHLAPSPEHLRQVNKAFAVYGQIIERSVSRSLAAGDNPPLQTMAAELAGIDLRDDPNFAGLVPKSLGLLLAGNLFDGFHTAAVGAANVAHVLMHHKEAPDTLNTDPSCIGALITEALRLEPPVLMLRRRLAGDIDYDGMRLKKGLIVHMFWGAGNYDPASFPDPHRFKPDREHQGLTTFGGGAHFCPGRFIAVMLCKTLVETFAEEGIALRPEGEKDDGWIGGHLMSQLSTFSVRVRRSEAA